MTIDINEIKLKNILTNNGNSIFYKNKELHKFLIKYCNCIYPIYFLANIHPLFIFLHGIFMDFIYVNEKKFLNFIFKPFSQ